MSQGFGLNKRGYAGLLLTDLSEAFDCIDHELLIAKLHSCSFVIKSLELIHSYLYERIQRVKINSSFSYWNNVELGIPQGSVKGPLPFNIYICDLFCNIIEIEIANYAYVWWPIVANLDLNPHCNHIYTTTLH